MEALIVYQSKNGTTRKFAEAISRQVKTRVDMVILKSIEDTTPQDIEKCDILYLGGWTSGLFGVRQKPTRDWVNFVSTLPQVQGKQTVLFTTYKFTAGNILHKMKDHLAPKGFKVIGSMKSRNGNFDYFSNGVLKYTLYQLVADQMQELKSFVSKEEGVLEAV